MDPSRSGGEEASSWHAQKRFLGTGGRSGDVTLLLSLYPLPATRYPLVVLLAPRAKRSARSSPHPSHPLSLLLPLDRPSGAGRTPPLTLQPKQATVSKRTERRSRYATALIPAWMRSTIDTGSTNRPSEPRVRITRSPKIGAMRAQLLDTDAT